MCSFWFYESAPQRRHIKLHWRFSLVIITIVHVSVASLCRSAKHSRHRASPAAIQERIDVEGWRQRVHHFCSFHLSTRGRFSLIWRHCVVPKSSSCPIGND